MFLLSPIRCSLLLTTLAMRQCFAEEAIGNAPNGTDVDIVLIVLDDDNVDGDANNATVAPIFTSATMMPTNASMMMNMTAGGDETPAPTNATTPSPSNPMAPDLVLNLEPTVPETPSFAPFPTVAIPPQAPQTRGPTTNAPSVSDFPSSTPTLFPTTGMPTLNLAACSLYSQCSNLTGDCCPTVDNVDLACCGISSVEETCERNTRCVDEWGLRGSCCPTLTGVYLDCCEAVPDDCQDENGNCTVLSTREYVQSSARATVHGSSYVVVVALTSAVITILA